MWRTVRDVTESHTDALRSSLFIAEQNILEIVELGGVPRMLKLISSPDRVTRCHALLCMCAMAPCGRHTLVCPT